ncbi:MAG: hypothetical protein M1286_01775 [Candidatus Marsarchaeota archaeon]|nr:hypothetical protein [Candidatus Marsarchaeota archaeon]
MNHNNELVWSVLTFALVASLTAFALYGVIGQVTIVSASANSIGANVAVPNTCIPLASNTAIIVPSTPAGSSPTNANVVTVTNFGNTASNIFVYGSALTYLSNTIGVSNILWNPTYSGGSTGNALTTSITGSDTGIVVPLDGGTNTVYFGFLVPSASPPGTYTGDVNVMLSC